MISQQKSDIWIPVAFFAIVISLFPLAVTPTPEKLSSIAAGVIWVSALLSILLNMPLLFGRDYQDGSLELMLTSHQSMTVMVLAKVSAYWLVTGLPLILLVPLAAYLLHLAPGDGLILLASVALGTPALSLLGALGAALTVSLKNSSVLLALLILPLFVPVLIFGVSSVSAFQDGLPFSGQLMLIAAYSIILASLLPWAIAASLKISISN